MRSGYGSCTPSSILYSDGLVRRVCKLKSEVRDGDLCFVKLTFELRGLFIQCVAVGFQQTEFTLQCRNIVSCHSRIYSTRASSRSCLRFRFLLLRTAAELGAFRGLRGMDSAIRAKISPSVPLSGCQAQILFVRATQLAGSYFSTN